MKLYITNNMLDLITIGDAVVDTHVFIDQAAVECDLDKSNCRLCLDYAAKIPITDSFQSVGGNAANVAINTSRLGLSVAMSTWLGRDANGKLVIQTLKRSGVITKLIKEDKKTSTRYAVILNYQGERTILSYHSGRNYIWSDLPPVRVVYYTSLSPGFETIQTGLINYLAKHPTVKLAFNPGSFQIKSALPQVLDIIKQTDILILNREEAEIILKTTAKKIKGVENMLSALLGLGAKEVTITDAAFGAYATDGTDTWYMPSYPVPVISKTGAGDAFSSGYLASRLEDHDIATALRYGIAASCIIIQSTGSNRGINNDTDLDKLIAEHHDIHPVRV